MWIVRKIKKIEINKLRWIKRDYKFKTSDKKINWVWIGQEGIICKTQLIKHGSTVG